MERSESSQGYNGEVSETTKIGDWSKSKPKKPNLQKAMKDSRALIENQPTVKKAGVTPPKKKPAPIKAVTKRKTTKVKKTAAPAKKETTKVKKPVKKVVKKKPVRKKIPTTTITQQKKKATVLTTKKEEIAPTGISDDDLDFLKETDRLFDIPEEPVKAPAPKKVVCPAPVESEVIPGIAPFPRKEILTFPNVTDPDDLDGICDLGSRVVIADRDHAIFSKVYSALCEYILDDTLRLQYLRLGSSHSVMFGPALAKATQILGGRINKMPHFGYRKNNEVHNFLLSDLMYTRTHTAYYVLIDVDEEDNAITRFILINADIIFTI